MKLIYRLIYRSDGPKENDARFFENDHGRALASLSSAKW